MQIIIPMAGAGDRFIRCGYDTIKPLIKVDGIPIIEHIIRMFPKEDDFLFICARNHLEQTSLSSTLERIAPQGQIVGIEQHKLGPVYTTMQARDYIRHEEPVILNYCDFSVHWDYENFKKQMEIRNCAGCLTAYRGFHPHSLGPNLYAYMLEDKGYMTEIREKQCFTSNRMDEYASAGTYYFKSGNLLKKYFQLALDSNMRAGGEFYASTPYNLLVEDGLDVYIFELEHFLQWGTPEDLEEYQTWSNYFAHYANLAPSPMLTSGTNLIPMAGLGSRFLDEGYSQPKPLVPVSSVPMVKRALDSLPQAQSWITLCRLEHLETTALKSTLADEQRDIRIITVHWPTDGQAATCLLARPHLSSSSPLLIGPCDAAVTFNSEEYMKMTTDNNIDCLVWTFRDHPHANRKPDQYGWVNADPDGKIRGISCKVPLHTNTKEDPGIIGIFWFREARFFLEAADALIAQNRLVNGEFYVDSTIEVMLEKGHSAFVFDVLNYTSFGNPDDVRTFEYWESYFSKSTHHPYRGVTPSE